MMASAMKAGDLQLPHAVGCLEKIKTRGESRMLASPPARTGGDWMPAWNANLAAGNLATAEQVRLALTRCPCIADLAALRSMVAPIG